MSTKLQRKRAIARARKQRRAEVVELAGRADIHDVFLHDALSDHHTKRPAWIYSHGRRGVDYREARLCFEAHSRDIRRFVAEWFGDEGDGGGATRADGVGSSNG